ncbi:hypothetical protein LCGC14_2966250, partial [marine sediment metagenome]
MDSIETIDGDTLARQPETLAQVRSRVRASQAAQTVAIERRKEILGIQDEVVERTTQPEAPTDPDELAAWNRRATLANVGDRVVELPRGMTRGVIGFVEETTIAAKDLARWVLPIDATIAGVDSMIDGGTFM